VCALEAVTLAGFGVFYLLQLGSTSSDLVARVVTEAVVILLFAVGLDMRRQVVKKASVFPLLEGLGEAAGAVADGVVAAVVLAIGKQQGQRRPEQLAHGSDGVDAPPGHASQQRALIAHEVAAQLG